MYCKESKWVYQTWSYLCKAFILYFALKIRKLAHNWKEQLFVAGKDDEYIVKRVNGFMMSLVSIDAKLFINTDISLAPRASIRTPAIQLPSIGCIRLRHQTNHRYDMVWLPMVSVPISLIGKAQNGLWFSKRIISLNS